jgi:hypothetical protein
MEALKPIIEDRIAWEKVTTKELVILKVDQEHHSERLNRLEELLEGLPALNANMQRIVDVIDGSARQSDVGALKRISVLEHDAVTYGGIAVLFTIVSGVMAFIVTALTFVFQHPWR